jgi:hypothetical protein
MLFIHIYRISVYIKYIECISEREFFVLIVGIIMFINES